MKNNTRKSKRSFNYVYKLSMLILPILLGAGLISSELLYEISSSNDKISKEINDYEVQIKQRMKDEVEEAVYIADSYYSDNKGKFNDDVIMQDIIQLLENLKSSDVGYFFAADYQGNNLLGPGKNKNVYDIEDINGFKVVQALIKTAKQGGGYVEYVMPPIDGAKQAPKISYVLPFQPFNCYIGAGVNLSEITAITNRIKSETMHKTLQSIIITGILILLFILLFRRVNSRFYRKTEEDINRIKDYLEKSATENAVLDTGLFHFLELELIGKHTGGLIDKRNKDQAVLSSQYEVIKETANKLEETNATLEEEITEHAKSLELLNESQERLGLITSTLPDIILIFDQNGYFLDCEGGQKLFLNLDKEALIGKNLFDLIPKSLASSGMNKITEALNSDQIQILNFKLDEQNGLEYYEARLITFQKNQVFAIVRNVTETKKMQLYNEYLSYHDQLTGVYNRRYFEEALVNLDNDSNLPISIALVDVNGLKLTNDAFGHQTGDRLLCFVTDILLKHCSSPRDFIARIGGDEFVIVCPNTNHLEMEKTISGIYQSIDDERDEFSVLSLSVGWETKTSAEQNMTDIFNKAEEYMYRKKLTEGLSMRNQTVQAIMKTLNEKNVREKIHSERVSKISRLIGTAMNLDYGTLKEIETAGLLHDIGKIAVDEDILNKAGQLTEEEYEKIKKHPESSYQILKSINAYAGLAEDVLSHHERWDGKGYPRKLKGEEISLIARIITVADSYEAMTSDRTYRQAMSKDQALEELKKNAGTQFDEQIIKIFVEKVFAQL